MSDWSDGALASNNSVAGFESDYSDWEAGDYTAPAAQDSLVPQLNDATAVGGWVSGADLPAGNTTDKAPDLTGWVSGSDLPGGAVTSQQWVSGSDLPAGFVDGGAASQAAVRTAPAALAGSGKGQTVATTSAAAGGASGVNRTGQQKTSGVGGFLDTLSAGLRKFSAAVSPATDTTKTNTVRPNNTAKQDSASLNTGQARAMFGGAVPIFALAALAWYVAR